MSSQLKVVATIVGILVVAGLVIYFVPRPDPPCQTGEYARLIGVGVDVQLQEVKALQSALGLSDSFVRGLDTALKDYSAQYDNACRDVTAARISSAQYQCMRVQMDQNLNSARRVSQVLEGAKGGLDPEAQRKILQSAYDELQQARTAGFGQSCVAGLDVAPKQVAFKGDSTLSYFTLVNASSVSLNYAITEMPDGFMPKRTSGTIAAADHEEIIVRRTLDRIPSTRPLEAIIIVESRPQLSVEFVVDERNARLWEHLAEVMRRPDSAQPSVPSALKIIDATLPLGVEVSIAEREALAATALFAAGFHAEAQTALQQAIDRDEILGRSSSSLKLAALISAERPEAQQLYAQIRDAQPTYEQAVTHGANVGQQRLGQVLLTQQFTTGDGQLLTPGTYELRLKSIDVAGDGAVSSANWVEFVQDDAVKGRELAAKIPTGVGGMTGKPHLEMLRRPNSTNLWLEAGGSKYLVNLPETGRLPS